MSNGILIFNSSKELLFIAGVDFLDGLYCGACLDVFVGGRWWPTRIERDISGGDWYLVGIRGVKLAGLPARV
jgi:hypothetical protein